MFCKNCKNISFDFTNISIKNLRLGLEQTKGRPVSEQSFDTLKTLNDLS